MRKERIKAKMTDLIMNEGQLGWLPTNPRQWTQKDIDLTKASLQNDPDFTEERPVLVVECDGKLLVFAGNLRTTAARALKWEYISAVLYTPENDEDKDTIKRRSILDNGAFGSWDYDMLANEWDDLPLPDWGVPAWDTAELHEAPAAETKDVKEDDFDEEKEHIEVRCKRGDVWQLGDHRLMCGDSTSKEDVAKLMDGVKADMAFTDPPYGVKYTGGVQFNSDGSVEQNNREMIANDDKDIYEDVFKILKEFVTGACYIWFAGTKAASLYNAAEKYGEIHSLIIWVKNGGYGALMANYKQKHEPCLYWKPKNARLNFCGATTETTIWDIKKDGINEYHPTQKPITLASKAIGNHKADRVLDLFGGSGSTMMAAEQLGKKSFLMEIDPHYCDVIIARWEKFTGKTATKIN
jgi:site-specific DNA-methyltransferase (adenine-specific)